MEVYSLVGFNRHLGNTLNSGHYVGCNTTKPAYEDGYKIFDDNAGSEPPEVYEISPEELELTMEDGYIFLYKRVTNR